MFGNEKFSFIDPLKYLYAKQIEQELICDKV